MRTIQPRVATPSYSIRVIPLRGLVMLDLEVEEKDQIDGLLLISLTADDFESKWLHLS